MARKKSEFLSALGVLFEIFRLFVSEILDAGGDDKDIRRIGTDPVLRKKLVEIVLAGKDAVSEFPVWKTITLGTRKSANEYRKALAAKGFQIGDLANNILGKIPFAQEEVAIDIVKLSVVELGFTRTTSLREILVRAKEFGLKLCPPEIGPALREQYPDQPMGEVLWIGMEPFRASDCYPRVFNVFHDGGDRWLGTYWCALDNVWNPGNRFVFVRPANKA